MSKDETALVEQLIAEQRGMSAIQWVEAITEVFQDPQRYLKAYSDLELRQWLRRLLVSKHIRLLFEHRMPWECRRTAIRSIFDLFRDCFASRCSPHLSHLSELGANPINGECYMWWDIPNFWPERGHPEQSKLDAELLGVLNRILKLKSDVCRESALHGLGHWHNYYPAEVSATIIAFLSSRTGARLRWELKRYAEFASRGEIA